jgi:hypothetical protein
MAKRHGSRLHTLADIVQHLLGILLEIDRERRISGAMLQPQSQEVAQERGRIGPDRRSIPSYHADDLILYSETREGAQNMLEALADFCNYSNMVQWAERRSV